MIKLIRYCIGLMFLGIGCFIMPKPLLKKLVFDTYLKVQENIDIKQILESEA